MTKLHEILAVSDHKAKQTSKILEETIKSLGKDHLFTGQVRTLTALREADKHIETIEVVELPSTVMEVLDYANDVVKSYFDISLSKEIGNTNAKSDLVVDGEVLLKDVPATYLLFLENRLTTLRGVYDRIPTLTSGIDWEVDLSSAKEGVYATRTPVKQIKTKQEVKFEVVVKPTEFQPAHVERVESSVDTGVYSTIKYSGMMTPVRKAKIMTNLDQLIAAVKAARMRANNVSIDTHKEADKLFEYIFR